MFASAYQMRTSTSFFSLLVFCSASIFEGMKAAKERRRENKRINIPRQYCIVNGHISRTEKKIKAPKYSLAWPKM